MDERRHNPETEPVPSPSQPAPRPASAWGPLSLAYAIFAGTAIVVAGFIGQLIVWQDMQLQLYYTEPVPAGQWPAATAMTAAVAVLLAIPLLFARRFPRVLAVGSTWLVSGVILALLGITRTVPLAAGETGLAVQAIACLVVALVLWPLWRLRTRQPEDPDREPAAPAAAWWALCAGAVTVVPWAWAGALGSVWETVAAFAVALTFAMVCGTVLGDRFWRPFAAVSAARRIWGGGAAAGIAMFLLAASVGGAGLHLLTMMTLPALAFAVAALVRRDFKTGRIVGAAVAPAVFGPLAFGDADEFLPLILGMDFGKWLFFAALAVIGIAWLVGVGYGLTARRLNTVPAVAAGTVVIVVALIGGTNLVAQPGFHGERLLVVMTEQADLSGITGDRDQRLREVRERLVDTAEAAQADLRAELTEAGLDWRPFYLLNAIEVDADLWHRFWLTERDDVAEVLLNPQSRPIPADEPAAGGEVEVSGGPQPNIEQVGAPGAWAGGHDGSGITIGIADSGVDGSHPALADRFRGGGDSWADPVRGSTTPVDPHGHGTHALGLALGGNGIGVAPGAQWMGCANLPRNAGNPADYLACLEFMLAPYAPGEDPVADGDPSRAPHVVTNSWGCPPLEGCDSAVLGPAVDALSAAGIFVVVAAGNSGPDCGSAATPPANYADAFTVGAVDEDGVVPTFSSRGPVPGADKPDLLAPGTGEGGGVVSAVPDGGYAPMTGTSMAAPHVAGAVAVLWQAHPELVGDVEATAQLLRDTAAPVTEAAGVSVDACDGPANTVGAGLLDVIAAVEQGA